MKKFLICIIVAISIFSLTACETSGSRQDIYTTKKTQITFKRISQPQPIWSIPWSDII